MAVQTGDRVNFVKLATPADFPSAQDIDDATLYFITSTKEVYLGSILISTGPSVTQTNSDSVNALHELLLSGSADNITRDEGARKTSHLRGNPSDGTLNISGQLTDAYGVQSSRILTQAQYNALSQAEQENGTDYYISDADPTVNQALWNKVGTASLDIGSNLSDAVNLLAAGGGGGSDPAVERIVLFDGAWKNQDVLEITAYLGSIVDGKLVCSGIHSGVIVSDVSGLPYSSQYTLSITIESDAQLSFQAGQCNPTTDLDNVIGSGTNRVSYHNDQLGSNSYMVANIIAASSSRGGFFGGLDTTTYYIKYIVLEYNYAKNYT